MPQQTLSTARGIAVTAGLALLAGLAVAVPADARPSEPSASVANDTLTILGTAGGDSIAVAVDPNDPDILVVDFGNGTLGQKFDRSTFSAVSVFLGRGADQFRTDPVGYDEQLTVDGGTGDDDVMGTLHDDRLIGGGGNDRIVAGPGNDTLIGNAGDDTLIGQSGNDDVSGGAGDDTVLWNPGDGSDTVDGGAGYDSLPFNGSNAGEIVTLGSSGRHAVLARNVGAVRMDLVRVEDVGVALLGSADSFVVQNLAGTDVTAVAADLRAFDGHGDAAADVVTVNGTNRADHLDVDAAGGVVQVAGLAATVSIADDEPTDALHVNTLGGNDTVDVSDAARAALSVTVDLGIGQVV